jgi:hypothetical protein
MKMNKEEDLNRVMAMAVKAAEEKLIMIGDHPDAPDYIYAKMQFLNMHGRYTHR